MMAGKKDNRHAVPWGGGADGGGKPCALLQKAGADPGVAPGH